MSRHTSPHCVSSSGQPLVDGAGHPANISAATTAANWSTGREGRGIVTWVQAPDHHGWPRLSGKRPSRAEAGFGERAATAMRRTSCHRSAGGNHRPHPGGHGSSRHCRVSEHPTRRPPPRRYRSRETELPLVETDGALPLRPARHCTWFWLPLAMISWPVPQTWSSALRRARPRPSRRRAQKSGGRELATLQLSLELREVEAQSLLGQLVVARLGMQLRGRHPPAAALELLAGPAADGAAELANAEDVAAAGRQAGAPHRTHDTPSSGRNTTALQ